MAVKTAFSVRQEHCVRKLVWCTTITICLYAIRVRRPPVPLQPGRYRYHSRQRQYRILQRYDHNTGIHLQPFDIAEISPGKLPLQPVAACCSSTPFTKKTDTLLKLQSVCIRSLQKTVAIICSLVPMAAVIKMMKNGILKAMPLDKNPIPQIHPIVL